MKNTTGQRATSDANRLGLDYRTEAAQLGGPPVPIVDAHVHVNGPAAAAIFREVCDRFGVASVWSQTQLAQAEAVREVMGDRIRFVAIPSYMDEDRSHAFRQGFLDNIQAFHDRFGARMVKLWAAPRFRDYFESPDDADLLAFDGPWRVRACELARSLGMMMMVHIADPDTWFATKYADASRYGTKAQQYEGLERMLDRFEMPWMAAHMGGWPEDLAFLDGLLSRHDNLVLDTSATKWMVRELSRHSRGELLAFLAKWSGRILFGTDIVTSDEHLAVSDPDEARFGATLASGPEQAEELYSSRYWAMRTLMETDYQGPSPIVDPDLAMVDPARFGQTDSPTLRGKALPRELLEVLYAGAARQLDERFDAWRDAR